MVRLPVYTSQGSVSSGADTLRLLKPNDGIGTELTRFGTAIGDAGLMSARANASIDEKTEAESKRISGLGDALVRESMETEWKRKQSELETNIDPTGAGYADAVEKAYDEHIKEYAPRFSQQRTAENQVLDARYRTQIVNRAIDFEYRTRLTTQKGVADKIMTDLTATVFENPEAFDTAMNEAGLKADVQGFGGRIKKAFLDDVRGRLENARLLAKVRDDAPAVIKSAEGAFSQMPVVGAHAEAKKIAAGAAASGMPLKLMLGIAQIESKLDPNVVPRRADGTLMSSAKGVFQFLDSSAYGKIDWKDTEGQARLLGLFLDKQKTRLEGAGTEATPGKLYMFHNIGEGLAMNVLRADPNERMGNIIARTYPSRPGLAAQIAVNNPSLYKSDMTAGEVRARYEQVVKSAMDKTSGLVVGSTLGTTDEIARQRMSDLLGVPVEKIGAGAFKEAVDIARKQYAENSKLMFKLAEGKAVHDGDVRIDPYDATQRKDLDTYAKTTGVSDAMRNGDEKGFEAARLSVRNANVIAQPYLHAARELIITGDDQHPGKAKAFEFLASIARENQVAWTASTIDDGTKGRVKQYRALTEGPDAIVTPAEAIKRITFEHSPAGDSAKKAAQELFKAHKGRELKDLDIGEVEAAVSKGLWRGAQLFDPQSATADVRRQAMFDNYTQSYEWYRIQGDDVVTAKKRALQDITDNYGVSNVFRKLTERAEMARFPIERRYAPIDAERPYKWIEEQGRSLVNAALSTKGFTGYGDDTLPAPDVEIRLVPTATTARDWKLDNPPAYNLMYRNPKNGMIELAVPDWRPNQLDAQQAFDAQFVEKVRASRATGEIKRSPEFAFVTNKTRDPGQR